jgi:hypothetical protein
MKRRGRSAGSTQSPETRAKISRANAARWQDPEYRAVHAGRLQAARQASGKPGGWKPGHKHSPETIEKIRRTLQKRWQEPEFRARHLPSLMAAVRISAKVRAIPAKGAARQTYLKVRNVLGAAAARSLTW